MIISPKQSAGIMLEMGAQIPARSEQGGKFHIIYHWDIHITVRDLGGSLAGKQDGSWSGKLSGSFRPLFPFV